MSAQITITIQDKTAVVKVIGHLTLQEILDTNRKLTQDGSFAYARRLWDLRECKLDLTTTEIRKVAAEAERMDRLISRTALLADTDLVFGLARMFEVFRSSEIHTVGVFRDEGEPWTWLLSD